MKLKTLFAGAALALGLATGADAANLAIFGSNNIATFYGASNSVSIVNDSQLSTPGFLNAYDAFIYTRDGYSFGQGLSVAAAANVKSFVKGNIILLNGDFQDDIGQAATDALFSNALAYVLSGGPGGYLGEYRGSFAAFSSNADGNNPIGLVNGSAGSSGGGQGGSDGEVEITAAGLSSPVVAGVPFPYNPGAVEFGATVTGINPAKVLAQFSNGNPAIVAGNIDNISIPLPSGVPEPATWGMLILGFFGIGGALRSRRRSAPVAA